MLGNCIDQAAPWLLGIGGVLGMCVGIGLSYLHTHK